MYLLISEDIFYDLLGGYLWLSWLWRLNLPSICQFGLVKLGFAGLINNSGFRKSGIFSLLCFCHKLHDFCWVYWHIWCGDLSLVWQPSWWADTFTCNMKKREKHIKIEDNTIGSNQCMVSNLTHCSVRAAYTKSRQKQNSIQIWYNANFQIFVLHLLQNAMVYDMIIV